MDFLNYTIADVKAAAGTNGRTVFSCFSGGGGSTMGYKLAGYDVIGNCEIDAKMFAAYTKNHNPKFPFNCDIRELLTADLPPELYDLDVLDGSPPCSSFSMAGARERNWGKEKKFREGQAEQVLDQLFFDFIALGERLKPKVIVAENVAGITMGKAKDYYNKIIEDLIAIGYKVNVYDLQADKMGVPQSRRRIFFVAIRNDVFTQFPDKVITDLNEPKIPYRDIYVESDKVITDIQKERLSHKRITDRGISDILLRIEGKPNCFNLRLIHKHEVVPTIPARPHTLINYEEETYISDESIIMASTFPKDFNFMDNYPDYVCGMSVPPKMVYELSRLLFDDSSQMWEY